MATTTRLAPGRYVTTDGRHEIVRAFDTAEWHLFEHEDGVTGEWCNTFPTKRDALEATARLAASSKEN